MKRLFTLVAMLAPVFFLLVSNAACSQKEPISSAEVVSKFVASLNNKDMETFSRLSATPLWVRQQDWASAKDGAGFTLGQANDTSLTDVASIKKYFSDQVKKIAVERETPNSASLSLLQDELKGSEKLWEGLVIHLFRRGMGDVEHIFVVGVDGKGKIVAVYLN